MSSYDFGERYEPGTDDCGFNSLPAGSWLLDGTLTAGSFVTSSYWTSTPESMNFSYEVNMGFFGVEMAKNLPKITIRCIRN